MRKRKSKSKLDEVRALHQKVNTLLKSEAFLRFLCKGYFTQKLNHMGKAAFQEAERLSEKDAFILVARHFSNENRNIQYQVLDWYAEELSKESQAKTEVNGNTEQKGCDNNHST